MLIFLAKRAFFMVLTMLAVSLLVFLLLEVNGSSVAVKVLGPYSSVEQRNLWLEAHGYFAPWYERYFAWLGRMASGDFGTSLRFKTSVADVLWPRLGNTAILAGCVFLIMVPVSVVLGVLAGMREGSGTDRSISVLSIVTTSVPEFASATFLSFLFVLVLKWLPGTSGMSQGFDVLQLVMPVAVLVLYDFGYVTRMMRASMAEVMQSPYIRTAVLKGIPYKRVILRHALRNALIAPFTVMILQLNYLLSGIIVTEVFFAYDGFGKAIYDAALFGDVYIVQAGAMVAVFVAVLSQFISDVGYTYLNPRIRFA